MSEVPHAYLTVVSYREGIELRSTPYDESRGACIRLCWALVPEFLGLVQQAWADYVARHAPAAPEESA